MIIKHNRKTKFEESFKWHKWYAWFPVVTTDGNNTIWLEYVYRKQESDPEGYHWEYSMVRTKEKKEKINTIGFKIKK